MRPKRKKLVWQQQGLWMMSSFFHLCFFFHIFYRLKIKLMTLHWKAGLTCTSDLNFVIFVIPYLQVYPLWEIDHLGELLSLHPGLQFTNLGWTISNSQQGTYSANVSLCLWTLVEMLGKVLFLVQQCSLSSQPSLFQAFWNTTVTTHRVELQTRLIQLRFQSSRLTILAICSQSCLSKQVFTVWWSLLIKLKKTVEPVETRKKIDFFIKLHLFDYPFLWSVEIWIPFVLTTNPYKL